MGVTIALCILANPNCCRDTPNYYIKQENLKDDLNIYKLNSEYRSFSLCPICSEHLNDKTIDEIRNIRNNYGPDAINDLKSTYDDLVNNRAIINVFPQLEETWNKIEEIKKNYEEKRYYRHKCEKKNKECYFNLFKFSVDELDKLKNFSYKDKRYDISQWKNDENLKNTLLEERTKANKIYLVQQYNIKVLEEYNQKKQQLLNEWEDMTFKSEYNIYLQNINTIKQNYRLMNTFRKDSSFLANITSISGVKYLSTKKKIIEFVSSLAYNDFDRECYYTQVGSHKMTEKEEREFQKFVNSRLAPPKLLKIVQDK